MNFVCSTFIILLRFRSSAVYVTHLQSRDNKFAVLARCQLVGFDDVGEHPLYAVVDGVKVKVRVGRQNRSTELFDSDQSVNAQRT
jgi:hypothetical protein